ncbi:hypothetical protein SLEP1_g9129 [Rubroshorea leprosula]|uniref:Uncharacterized protein n=1 Tax=Rubroshorea leprosula TaxID=152421 RepID=A0AAV5I9Y2_9ROSI|nr:hypothetical protein SLEP1_g9129 [Rubroshorea leprosula]
MYWCKAFFDEDTYCDVVDNNMCESFNFWIMEARYKAIISSVDTMREQLMERIAEKMSSSHKWKGDIAPRVKTKLGKNKNESSECKLLWDGTSGFEGREQKRRNDVGPAVVTLNISQSSVVNSINSAPITDVAALNLPLPTPTTQSSQTKNKGKAKVATAGKQKGKKKEKGFDIFRNDVTGEIMLDPGMPTEWRIRDDTSAAAIVPRVSHEAISTNVIPATTSGAAQFGDSRNIFVVPPSGNDMSLSKEDNFWTAF